uniref:Arf guanine-nucleotide exchange factor gnom-like isoform x1 n=1 Tax=Tetraselmis sp. GSL018 TaxID=582737 RepID=A0A061R742_9CHLO
MAMDKALLLNAEISSVMAAMRQNTKWAMIPRHTDDSLGDEYLLEKFRILRRNVFQWQDWSTVDPMTYLEPFLEVIASPATSGPITAMALSSVYKLLHQDVIGSSMPGAYAHAFAMHNTAEAVTHCKFEATDEATDKAVLCKILDVLLACVKCPTGKYLSDSDVCNIFQACFRIGHTPTTQTDGVIGAELLLQISRSILSELVVVVFGRLSELQDPSPGGEQHPSFDAHKITKASSNDLAAMQGASCADEARGREGNGSGDSVADSLCSTEDVQDMAYPRPVQCPPPGAAAENRPAQAAPRASSPPRDAGARAGPSSEAEPQSPEARDSHSRVVSISRGEASMISPRSPEPADSPLSSPRVWRGYGVGCAVEVLGFLATLIGAEGQEADHFRAFGLELVGAAMMSGRSAFLQHEALMAILQNKLFEAMSRAARFGNLAALSSACNVALYLYAHLGSRVLLQLETFIKAVLLRIAEGKGYTYEQQEAALEGILSFCHQPSFVRDAYANLDCRIERANVFEDICGLLSKTAFPVGCPLGSIHLMSLDGLLAILNTLSSSSASVAEEEDAPAQEAREYIDIWTPLVEGSEPLAPVPDGTPAERAWVRAAQYEKHLKGRLKIAADHFNRDPKKGFQFLQAIKLLPEPLEPKAVAYFLRACPGLQKKTIGTLLGEVHFRNRDQDGFYLEVLEHFTNSFDFTGMQYDTALRLYLESFHLPGESQKIDRIVRCFGERFFDQGDSLFKSKDAAYVFGYSVIMLNTDAHNSQVKNKMTLEGFVANNRGINDGENFPESFLKEIYESIVGNAIKLEDADGVPGVGVGLARWAELRSASMRPRGQLCRTGPGAELLDRDMFCLIWGPTVAAISVVLDHAEDAETMKQALDGLALAAHIAAQHNVDEVMDSIAVSLCKFTSVLNPNALRPLSALMRDPKAIEALRAVFKLTNRYGDCLRAGWRNIMDVIVRLHKLKVLPESVFFMEGEETEASLKRIPLASRRPAQQGTSSGMLGFKWPGFSLNSLIALDDGSGGSTPTENEAEAERQAKELMHSCRINEIFSDSKFLRADSLVELVRSIVWASGIGGQGPPAHGPLSQEDKDTAELCLELLVGTTIRNRDRIELLWPLVHLHLETIIKGAAAPRCPIAERAVLGLLRVCQRLLPYKEDMSDELLRSLHLIFRLDPKVAEDLAEVITAEVLGLVKSSASYIRSEWGWNTVCALLKAASHHPAAFPKAFEALGVISQEDHLMKESFVPCLETALAFIDNSQQQNAPERAKQVMDVLEGMNSWLVARTSTVCPEDQAAHRELWLTLIQCLSKQVLQEADPNLRNHAVVLLHRVVSPELTEGLSLPPEMWGSVFQDVLLPLVSELARMLHGREGGRCADLDRTLRLAVNMLSKTLLQCLPILRTLSTFPDIWVSTLTALQECTRNHSEELAEAVPENLKNMLRYLSHQRVLVPGWSDAAGSSLWELTWKKSQSISTGLTPQVLEGTAS